LRLLILARTALHIAAIYHDVPRTWNWIDGTVIAVDSVNRPSDSQDAFRILVEKDKLEWKEHCDSKLAEIGGEILWKWLCLLTCLWRQAKTHFLWLSKGVTVLPEFHFFISQPKG
jgi:hypothetical protein